MPRTAPVTNPAASETKKKPRAPAKATKRSQSFLGGEAVDEDGRMQAWQIRYIADALAEAEQAPDEGVPHEEVVRWLDSRGTEDELPMPGAYDQGRSSGGRST